MKATVCQAFVLLMKGSSVTNSMVLSFKAHNSYHANKLVN